MADPGDIRAPLAPEPAAESFAQAISHDLRAPLRAIEGYAQALVEDYGDRLPAEAREFVSRIREARRTVEDRVDALLQLSRLGHGSLRAMPTDLAPVAIRILEDLRRTEPARRVVTRVADRLPVTWQEWETDDPSKRNAPFASTGGGELDARRIESTVPGTAETGQVATWMAGLRQRLSDAGWRVIQDYPSSNRDLDGMPQDARIVGAHYHPHRDGDVIALVVESMEFPPVGKDHMVPAELELDVSTLNLSVNEFYRKG